ncbi:MAG: peptidase MA family metallohydrolase [Bacteroidota bacterium]
MRRQLFLLLALMVLWAEAGAQEFGQNKVHYKHFDWYFIQSDHFDIYFTRGGEYLANFTASVAESSLASIQKSFRYQIDARIPIIVYNSHNDFQQTNVVSEYLPEGVGGVTELFKNRVVIPFEGSYSQFRHVIHHELVHAVMNEMFYGGSLQSIIANNIQLQFPLWFTEGLAEYESTGGMNTSEDMFMRDVTVHEHLPPIQYLDGYYAYRGGQSIWWYISQKYGEQKVGEILNRIKGSRSVEQGFRGALGLSTKELGERWMKELKKIYWPDVANRESPSDYARRLTNHVEEGNFYNSSPALSPQGDKLAFISDRSGYFDVYLMSTIDGKIIKRLVKGNRTNNFEELHLLTPGLTWSPDGKRIAIAVKAGPHDAIFLIDVNSGEEEELTFDLDGIYSVSWSPKGDKLTFVGQKLQQSDIYVYDLDTKQLTNLTDDLFSDAEPSWSPDGSVIYFASDRRDEIDPQRVPKDFEMWEFHYGQLDLYSVDVATRRIQRLTDLPESDETSPVASPDGKKLLYVSDANGINNLYELDLSTGASRPITNSLTGVFQLSLSQDGSKLAFTSMINGGFDLFLLRSPFEPHLAGSVKELALTQFRLQELARKKEGAEVATVSSKVAASKPISVADKLVAIASPKDTSQATMESARIDLQNYVFGQPIRRDTTEALLRKEMFHPVGNRDSSGNYRIYKYKLNFSPDIIYGNAAYTTFYGIQGSTIMAFSDMLGDHQIYLLTNLLIDLKNSDYAIQYLYLPTRINWGFQAFHTARFLLLFDPLSYTGYSLYRFRMYGGGISASYPFSRFRRIDFGLMWLNLLRENLDNTLEPGEHRSLLLPTLSYVHDNTLWGFTSPINGSRSDLSIYGTPKLGSHQGIQFATVTLDYRTYVNFGGPTQPYVLAARFFGGGSFGANAQKFFIGGVEGWINRQFAGGEIPIQTVEDFVFLTPVLPLRGYDYNQQIGTKAALLNLEFRYPLIRYLVAGPLPISFQNITGVFFVDVGSAWSAWKEYKAFERDASGSVRARDLLTGIGLGVRIFLFYFPLRFDVAWAYDYNTFSPPRYYFSLAGDF